MKKTLLALALGLSVTTSFAAQLDARLETQALRALGFKNTEVTLTTLHKATVTNNTDQVQTIFVFYEICADNKGCDKRHYKIQVNPHDAWSDGVTMHLYPIYGRAGRFNINGTTQVTGPFGLNAIYPANSIVEIS